MVEDTRRRTGEPPALVTPTGIDVRTRVAGYTMVDILIAGTAILISCVSLFIAVRQSQIMEKTLAASSWPLLQYGTGNTDEKGKPVINMSIINAGVGPATIRSLKVVYNGRTYNNWFEFLQSCCGYKLVGTNTQKFGQDAILSNRVEDIVLRSGDKADFLVMPLSPANESVWKKLDKVRFQVRFKSCYCSVLGDCWLSDLSTLEQQHVKKCPRPEQGAKYGA